MTPWRSAMWRKVIAKPKEYFAVARTQNAAKSRNWRDEVPEHEDLQRYSLKPQCACLLILLPLHTKRMSHACEIMSSPSHLGWCFRKRHLTWFPCKLIYVCRAALQMLLTAASLLTMRRVGRVQKQRAAGQPRAAVHIWPGRGLLCWGWHAQHCFPEAKMAAHHQYKAGPA